MKKKHFEDLEKTDAILYAYYIIARIAITIGIIICVIWGIVMCAKTSVKYGSIMIFGGLIAGAIGYVSVWCMNIVLRCFYDAACATKELYESQKKPKQTAGYFVIQNAKKNLYASEIVDDGVKFSENEDDAMLFDTEHEAMRVVKDFRLTKDDGWFIKQIEI